MSLKGRLIAAIIILIPLSVFPWINYFDLRYEEPRRGIVALEMYLTGDYIVPRIHGTFYYNKPPFFNWMILGLFSLFGRFDEWLVRLPSLLGWLGIGILNFFTVKKYVNKDTAYISSFYFLTAGDIYFYETMESGEMDLFYSFLVVCQVLSIFHFWQQRKWLPLFLLSYAFMAMGLLTKGLPSLPFQALTLLAIAVYNRQWKWLFSWQHFAGILLSVLLVGGYFFAYSLRAPLSNFLFKLFNEASEKSGFESRIKDLLLSPVNYPLATLKWLLPWSLVVVFFFVKGTWPKIRANPYLQFVVFFIFFNLPLYFFTGSPKSRYVFMFFPFFTTLLAYVTLTNAERLPKIRNGLKWIGLVLMCLFMLVFLVVPFLNIAKPVSMAVLKGFGIAFLLVLMIYCYWKRPTLRNYAFILFLVLAKTGFNFFYFPIFKAVDKDRGMNIKPNLEAIVQITGKDPVYYFNHKERVHAKMAIGPIKFDSVTMFTPPFISYEVPFYYTQKTQNILRFTDQLEPGNYYITLSDAHLNKPFTILHRFTDYSENKEVMLIKTGDPE